MKATYIIAVAVVALLSAAALPAQAAILYDGSITAKPLPANQGWSYGTIPLSGASATQTAVSGGVRLNSTTVVGEKAGYFSTNPILTSIKHPGMEPLDRAAGYTVVFDVKINSESHTSDHRAGFSIIAISSDYMGIELGFWTDTVFAQEAGFTHAEEADFSTAGMTRYELAVTGNAYALSAAGSPGLFLTGSLRDYTPAAPTPDVYEIPSFLFLGDDTSSAAASVDIAYIELVPMLPGDTNDDGVVNAADYITLKHHMGQGSGANRADGDFDFDGEVDWDDLQLLIGNYGAVSAGSGTIASSPPSGTIPEPATLSLLAVLALSLPKRGSLAALRRRRMA